MAISAVVNAVFNIDNKIYTASLAIPSSAPTKEVPFLFSVISQAPAAGGTTPPPQTLLAVAVGGTSEVYVAVSPPMDIISGAIGSDVVQDLNVVVSEGTYDPKTHTFS
ncbi:hypothetical protein [Pseudomonas sp. ICMP 460]|uniref:hypothetical protein n=1 Tax=Pseudomonas TaxID=286 RepID=UPI000C07FCD3|nr:hypothetical protein [Pseudomonas sp. ICMP 460]PHN19642.1 hypothetical protein AO240_10735 [Pseudomonas sp. ICMP 460]